MSTGNPSIAGGKDERESSEREARARSHQTKGQARREFDSWSRRYDRSILNYFLFRPSYLTMLEEIARWLNLHSGGDPASPLESFSNHPGRDFQRAVFRSENASIVGSPSLPGSTETQTEPFRVLDVGCGTASFTKMLVGTGWPVTVVGLDYSPAMCALASVKLNNLDDVGDGIDRDSGLDLGAPDATAGARATIVAGDSEHLPFAAGSFDIVTCANSFHHYPHQQAVVLEMRRVLRPGGRLILLDGFRDNVIGWVTYDVIVTGVEKHVHHASWREMDEFLRHAGFRNIQKRKVNVFCPILATMGDV